MKKKPKATNALKIDDLEKPKPIHVRREERVKRHKEQALKWDGKRWGEFQVKAQDLCVDLVAPRGCTTVDYAVSDEEWTRLTGWKK